jgi:hypothetical protein
MAGFLSVPSATNNGYGVLRAAAAALTERELIDDLRGVRVCALGDICHPSRTHLIDLTHGTFDIDPPRDSRFYIALAHMIAEELACDRDMAFLNGSRPPSQIAADTRAAQRAEIERLLDRAILRAHFRLDHGLRAIAFAQRCTRSWRCLVEQVVALVGRRGP